jgi:hypothetical protein
LGEPFRQAGRGEPRLQLILDFGGEVSDCLLGTAPGNGRWSDIPGEALDL